MATSKEGEKDQGKGHLAMKKPPIVSQQELGGGARAASGEGESLYALA
jgi:hypothetical protein